MTDELDRLRAALKAAHPRPDADVRARTIAQAQKSFEAAQGSGDALRPTSDRPENGAGYWTRIRTMLNQMTSRPALLATSSFAVLALAVFVTSRTSVVDPFGSPEGDATVTIVAAKPEARPSPETRALGEEAPQSAPLVLNDSADNFVAGAQAPAPVNRQSLNASAVQAEAVRSAVTAKLRERDAPAVLLPQGDAFPAATPNGLKITADEPVSTFSVDVDTTSYALMRMAALDGYPLPKDAIRLEEMINYFDYDYPRPASADVPFTTSVSVSQTPWNAGTKLMQIGIQGYEVDVADRAPMGLVFLIDTSGSMEDPMKLPLLRKSFGLLLNTLKPEDTVAIVTYAGSAGLALEPTNARDRDAIMGALERLSAGGSTAGQAGLQQAYSVAEGMIADGQSARIVLATDGDFNVGISDPEALTGYVAEKRDNGVFLSVLGFGRGNYTDTIMQAIAQNGNGVAAYIDSLAEAQKVLVEDVTSALVTIASDVKIQVEFNPAMISEYRLIGYETRALAREDFNNDRVDAGDIGAGHSVTAIYEITPKGSDAELTDPLRYSASEADGNTGELAFLKLRYKTPGAAESRLITTPVYNETAMIGAQDVNFATAVAAAGRLMRGDDLGGYDLSDARALAAANTGADSFGYRAEFVRILRLLEAQ